MVGSVEVGKILLSGSGLAVIQELADFVGVRSLTN
jgi:hypothetical protein